MQNACRSPQFWPVGARNVETQKPTIDNRPLETEDERAGCIDFLISEMLSSRTIS